MRMEYDITTGRFGTFYVNPGQKGNGLDECDSASLTPFNTIYPNTTPIMQFTGLTDKKGKEIYEGDILRFERWPYDPSEGDAPYDLAPVSWKDGGFVLNDVHRNYLEGGEEFEIVGNIYENADLLEV